MVFNTIRKQRSKFVCCNWWNITKLLHFIKLWLTSLHKRQIRKRFPLKSVTFWTINDILQSCNENITISIEWHKDIESVPDSKASFVWKVLMVCKTKKADLNKITTTYQKCKHVPVMKQKRWQMAFIVTIVCHNL